MEESQRLKDSRILKNKFRDEIRKETCEGCKRNKAVSLIRGFPLCAKCFSLVKMDNDLMFGKEDIPSDLNIHRYKIDKSFKRQHSIFFKHHKDLLEDEL